MTEKTVSYEDYLMVEIGYLRECIKNIHLRRNALLTEAEQVDAKLVAKKNELDDLRNPPAPEPEPKGIDPDTLYFRKGDWVWSKTREQKGTVTYADYQKVYVRFDDNGQSIGCAVADLLKVVNVRHVAEEADLDRFLRENRESVASFDFDTGHEL